MKTDTRMILAPLTALAVAFGAYAFSPQEEDFESYAEGTAATNVTKFCSIGGDESEVAAADGNKYLNVSTDEGTLFRSINDLDNGNIGTAATVHSAGIDIDMTMKFTIMVAGDEPEFSADDKLALWLQDEGTSTNLLARGGLYTGSDGTYSQTANTGTVYRLSGVTVNPGEWTNVKIKALANINSGSTVVPGFEVWVGNDQATVAVADGQSALVSSTAIPLAAVGFSGNGAVDDISIVDNATAGTVIELVSGVTSSYNETTGAYTFTAPAGSVIGSLLVNGDLVPAAAGQSSYTWTSAPGASVVVAATKQLTAAEHPWYENPGAVVLAENLPGSATSAFHGQGQDEFLGLTYTTGPERFDLYTVDEAKALTTVMQIAKAQEPLAGLRGVAISKALGIALLGAYYRYGDKSDKGEIYTYTNMLAVALSGEGTPVVVNKLATHSFDSAAFSPDGKYLFSNALKGETSNQFIVKWSVADGGATLTKLGSISAGGRARNLAYARINERDLVFVMADTGKIAVIDMTGDTDSAWTAVDLTTGIPALSYGSLCVSGVNAEDATPTLTVATSINNDNSGDVLNVYTLTVPASGAVTATLYKSFDQAAMAAAGFGTLATNVYGNTVYVTDDNKTIYFGRADHKLYAGQYAVASVYNTLYTNFTEAVSAITNADDYVTLFADASTTMAAGATLKVKTNGHTFTPNVAIDVVLSDSTDENGVTTFTATAGVAAVYDDNNAWVWFGSFADAFTYARAQSYQPKMKFKVGSDFTPAISSDFGVWMLEFIATTDDPITINLANGNAKLVSSYITFPATATLNAVTGNISSMTGGTLNVPSGVVLELASYATDGSSWNIAGLSGSGTIKNDGKSMYYFLGNPQYNLPTRLRDSSWCGTLELCGSNTWETEFNKFANANSKVRFNGLTTPLYTSGNDTVAIELVGSGLTISGAYESARTYAVGGTITGSGALTLADNTGSLLLSGDTSGFTGSVTVSGTSAAVTFGAATTGNGQRIVIQSGKTATIGAGATWTATNLVLLGELTVNGTLAVNDSCIWCNNGAGVLRYANKDTLPTSAKFASSWNSKCIIACDPGNKRFVLNNFGNANSTLEIAGDNGVFSALPSTDNTTGTAPSINPAVILTANWTVSDGWAAADKVTTFSKLSGSGNLTVDGSTSGTAPIYYTITELDNYTGTLGGARGNFTIGKVNVATPPADGACIVKTAIGTNGSIADGAALYVAGVDSGKTLEYKADGANGAGLYVAVPAATYPTYVGSDTTLQGQYDAWVTAFGKADTTSVNETAFLLNVDPDTGDTTLDATAVTISGTTVTITIDHNSVNGYPYVKSAATLSGLSTATPVAATVVNGVITLPSQTGAAAFYKVGVSSTPIVAE